MKSSNYLVSGCGGDISQSIGKILTNRIEGGKVIGCDIHNDHAGHFIFHECHVIERANSPSFIDSLATLVKEQNVEFFIPTPEIELEQLLNRGYVGIGKNCTLIKPNDLSLHIGVDKLKTARFLEENGKGPKLHFSPV